jgi:flagellin
MKEVATYSANGVLTPEQREILSTEFSTLASEIDRIAYHTSFKGVKLLDGSLSTRNNVERQGSFITANKKRVDPNNLDPSQNGLKIHFGPGNNRLEDYYFIRIGDLTMNGLLRDVGDPLANSTTKIAVSTQHAAQIALDTIHTAMLKKESNRYVMGLMQNRLEVTLNTLEDELYNVRNASSNIADADLAREMMEFARSQVLAQAATAMSAQANVIPQIALKLLRF